ncbi:SH3 domain-containing protein [Rhodobacteraceae bacterium CCMM004]|nr:SH3 domain-containing protein [Rhodobacteraceae bacterium CCMM004]
MLMRLTTLLCATIGTTMIIAGQPPADDATEVARASEQLPGGFLQAQASTAPVPLDDRRTAIEMALAATEAAAAERAAAAAAAATEVKVAATPAPKLARTPEMWEVTGNRVNLRAGPSTGTAVLGQVVRGDTARVLDRRDDGWLRIQVSETGLDAYIFGDFLAPVQES